MCFAEGLEALDGFVAFRIVGASTLLVPDPERVKNNLFGILEGTQLQTAIDERLNLGACDLNSHRDVPNPDYPPPGQFYTNSSFLFTNAGLLAQTVVRTGESPK
jgi:hypothetical protein